MKYKASPREQEKASSNDIAIVGLALRVPGANDPVEFWKNLTEGRETISFFEKNELEFPEEFDLPNYVPAKGIVENIDQFDASFFGILPMEAKIMDPQQRIFLELAWEAMERSGYTPDTHQQRIGVYAGTYIDTYLLANLCTDREFLDDTIKQIRVGSLQTEIGNDKDYIATRASFKLNLRGPAMTVGTACSTSLVAIAEACRAIRDGLCDMALAGGAAITVPHKRGYFHTEQGINSADGHCRVFDEKGSGTVFGNGAGVVMLKRLDDAVRDRDHIHAVIRGLGLNNDGRSKQSYAAPSPEGQAEAIQMAHRDAGVDPRTITAIEAHGTGTPLGDPIEFSGLNKAFRDSGVEENQFCALGSLKTFIGHLDVASGVCGVIKTALSLENAQLPPLLHFQKANPKIDFENSPFFPNAKLSVWQPPNGIPRRAGVSSYGVGGTNAHVVMEEAPLVTSKKSNRPAQLFLLSAKTETALETAGKNLATFTGNSKTDPADAAWTLAIGRTPFKRRRAVVASDFDQLSEKLARKQVGAKGAGASGKINFLFPGQGAQTINMARSIYESEPRFCETVDRCAEIVRPFIDENLTGVLFPAEGENLEALAKKLKDTRFAQPAIFTIEYALADLWKSWGILPEAMVGHSVGEFVAACHAGVFSLEEALEIICARGRLMSDLPRGGMLSVRLPEDDCRFRLPETLDLAAVNGPELCVVAGPHDELKKFATILEADDVVARPLHTSHAFHSRMMDPVIDEFTRAIEKIKLNAPNLPILSTVTGEWLSEKHATDPKYWARHLRETVQFSKAIARLGIESEGQIFIETGPGQTLTSLASQTLDRTAKHLVVASCAHPKDEDSTDFESILESLGRVWAAGVEIDWEKFYTHEIRKRIPLPTYPFERKRHWVDPKPAPTNQQDTFIEPTLLDQNAPTIQPCSIVEQTLSDRNSLFQTKPDMSTNTTCRIDAIAAETREILTNLSGIPGEELVGDATFLELGFDSLLLTQVSKAFQDGFGTEVKMRQLMTDFSTIDALVEHFDATLDPDRFRESAPAPAPVSAPQPMAAPAPVAMQMPVANPIPVSGDVQSVIAQQMELMRQQLSLLQGGVVAPAPVQTPAPAPVAAQKPQPVSGKKSESSAPSTTINREVDNTLTDSQKAHLEKLVAEYTAKTGSSKKLAAQYRQWFADPRTVSGFNRLWKEMIYQIVVKKSKGSRLLDIDGNEYVDILNGFGPGFLGHSPDFITNALHDQLDRGVEVGPQCQAAMEAAKLFCEVTGNERASFVNTGSEAVQAAMRLSRTVTGRDKVVVFTKDYHGNFDEVLVRGVGSGDKLRSMPVAPGIPHRAVDDVIVLEYGSDESLEIIRNRASELAAVIVEPVQSRRPEFQPKEFIQELRKITEDAGTAFVFDEVITGFRAGPHGAQGFFEVEADIATYGKICGGGMPIGVVAGKAKFMDTFDGGQWQYGDDSFPEHGVTFFAGTFVRHPLAMVAVREMLLHLRESGQDLWTDLNAKADRLAGTVNQMFLDNGIPFRMPNFGSLMFVRHIDDNKYANLLFFHLRQKGVFLLEGFPSYVTTAHTDADIEFVIDAFRESIAEMLDAGFFTRPDTATISQLNGSRLNGPPAVLSENNEPIEELNRIETVKGDGGKKPQAGAQQKTFPLTEPLAEVWLASQASEDGSLCFNEVVELTFDGPLDVASLRGAIQDVVDRHEGLRAVFLPNGDGLQIQPELEMEVPLKDLSGLDREERREKMREKLDLERSTPFDLEDGPLFKVQLLRLAEDRHALIMNAHHLVCDGWSYNVVSSDLSTFYAARLAGEKVTLDPAPQFGAFAESAALEEERRNGGASEKYWLSRFAEPVPTLTLPRDGANPGDSASHRSERIFDRLDHETMRQLKQVAGKSGATLFAMLMGAFQVLLSRIGRQNRLMTVFPMAGQNISEGAENLVGHCVNFLPFIGDVDGDVSFSDFLKSTQQNLFDAFEYQDYTYGQLLKKLPADQRPCAEAVFNLERMDGYEEFAGLRTEIEDVSRKFAMNPLFLNALETDDSIEFHFTFQTDLFTPETARQWLTIYHAMLRKIIATPDASIREVGSTMSPEQFTQLRQWNATTTEFPRTKTVSELFEEIVVEHESATAVTSEGKAISYAELKKMADRIAGHLAENGVSDGDRVGLFLERSTESIAAILAILKLGATFVPLDPDYPAERLNLMLADSGVKAVVTQKSLADRLPDSISSVIDVAVALKKGRRENEQTLSNRRSNPVGSDAPSCVIYTSGSTGTPKGVVLTHRGIIRLVRNTNYCELGPDETLLHAASICFDASIFEIFGAILNGGTLALPPAGPLSLETICHCIKSQNVTTIWLTSGLFQLLVEENLDAFANVRQLLTGGDVVPISHAKRVLDAHPNLKLINGYGPTENTTFTTAHAISKEDLTGAALPIGRPISNTTAWILDENDVPVAPGIPGELCCGGEGLALEYLNKPELTADRFFTAKIGDEASQRFYRTGDLSRFGPDGAIEFMGRIDHQVKIRGFRVEPGEIEARLATYPFVGQCKIVARGEGAAEKKLVAYVTPLNGQRPDPEELRDFLRSKLPNYMVPAACVVMDELPVTRNGKIDTRALPEPGDLAKTGPIGEPEATVTDFELRLTELWEEILGVRKIERDDDFFMLGGHSLLGMKLFSRIQREFDLSLPLSVLFKTPTVRQLAKEIEKRQNESEEGESGSGYYVVETAADPESESPSSAVSETTVLLQPNGEGPALFGVHGGDGGVFFYRNLADQVGEGRPFYAFEAAVLTEDGPIHEEPVEETAARYVAELLKIQPKGPFNLCGYSFGGVVAYEMACQLEKAGGKIGFLGLIDTENPAAEVRQLSLAERVAANWNDPNREKSGVFKKAAMLGKRVSTGLGYRLRFGAEGAVARAFPTAKNTGWLRQVQVRQAYERSMESYVPPRFSGDLTLFRAMEGNDKFDLGDDYRWGKVVDGKITAIDVPGNHISIFHKENIGGIANALRESLPVAKVRS